MRKKQIRRNAKELEAYQSFDDVFTNKLENLHPEDAVNLAFKLMHSGLSKFKNFESLNRSYLRYINELEKKLNDKST